MKKYKVKNSRKTVYEVLRNNVINAHLCYGHSLTEPRSWFGKKILERRLKFSKTAVAHEVKFYKEFIAGIRAAGWSFVKGQNISNLDNLNNYVFFRHDVDGDIVAAIDCAEVLETEGCPGTFYILHTSTYYGHFDPDGVFHRNECMLEVYKYIQDLGHEIGLHTDGLGAFLNNGVDPIACVEKEIQWLQSNGINIVSTAPHNSPYVHNASNSAIFKGRSTLDPYFKDVKIEVKDFGEKDGKRFKLNALDEKKLGLLYEANDVYKDIGKKMDDLVYISIVGYEKIVVSSFQKKIENGGFVSNGMSHSDVSGLLMKMPKNNFLYVSTHPEYYGNKTALKVGYNFNRYPFRKNGDVSSYLVDYIMEVKKNKKVTMTVRRYLSSFFRKESKIRKFYEKFVRDLFRNF